MKVKLKDIKQGKTFWLVSTYVGQTKTGTSIERLFVNARPKRSKYTKHLFVDVSRTFRPKGAAYKTEHSVDDMNVIPNKYNMHHLFATYKSALRHAARMEAQCFSNEELKRVHSIRISNQEDNFSDVGWPIGDYPDEHLDEDCAEDETYALPYSVKEGT